ISARSLADNAILTALEAERNRATMVETEISGDLIAEYERATAFESVLTENLSLKSPLISPEFSGVPTAPTPAFDNNTNQLATTEFVKTATSDKFVDLTNDQAISGTKTFTGSIKGDNE